MVLESLINPFTAEKKPWEMFFIGLLYNSVSIILSLIVFRPYASLVMVFLTSMACIPLMYATIKQQEEFDVEIQKESILLKKHSYVLLFFLYFFLGIIFSVFLWYILLPFLSNSIFSSFFTQSTHQDLFGIQEKIIASINSPFTGKIASSAGTFITILNNNLGVLFFCILFAFFYGVGSIFILTWNASVVGVAIGSFILEKFSIYSGFVAPIALMRYLTHGIFELTGFFTAGLAGGIISIAVIKHEFGTKKFESVVLDSVDLILVSIGLLIVAALIETYITPLLF